MKGIVNQNASFISFNFPSAAATLKKKQNFTGMT